MKKIHALKGGGANIAITPASGPVILTDNRTILETRNKSAEEY
jgi:hypothetical protein